ncbi:hypothetical protein Q0Z83_035310 [Actinoplanes sichuanensis]|nr:hypothetical protein Q0Z83_035310 [Actinoplanes sichuanensis]
MNLSDLVLPVLLVVVWVRSWWRGTRRFRLWFALLAPTGCVAGLVLAVIGAFSGAGSSCSGSSCTGSRVQRWAADVDAPSDVLVWWGRNAQLGLAVAVVLTVVTLIVEYILLVRRDSREAATHEDLTG